MNEIVRKVNECYLLFLSGGLCLGVSKIFKCLNLSVGGGAGLGWAGSLSSPGCRRQLEAVLVVGDVPRHLQSTVEVPLSKV